MLEIVGEEQVLQPTQLHDVAVSITSRQDALCYTVGGSACSSPQLFQRQFREQAIDIYCMGVLFKQFTVVILFLSW